MQSRIDELEVRLAEATRALAEERREKQALAEEAGLLRRAGELMPFGVVLTDVSGRVLFCNAAMRTMARGDASGAPEEVESGIPAHELRLPDGVTPSPPERDPTRRALEGESIDGLESVLCPAASPEKPVWVSTSSRPILGKDGEINAAVTIVRDVTEHKEILKELDAVIVASDTEKRDLIAQLEAGILALQVPIIEVWDDVLALPVIGAMDDRRSAEITSRLLEEIVQRGSRFVIIDWTGVDMMDTSSAQHLLDLVRAVSLVGAECILTGIRPAVAVSLLHLDVRFEHLRLLRNVKYALRHCLAEIRKAKPVNQAQR